MVIMLLFWDDGVCKNCDVCWVTGWLEPCTDTDKNTCLTTEYNWSTGDSIWCPDHNGSNSANSSTENTNTNSITRCKSKKEIPFSTKYMCVWADENYCVPHEVLKCINEKSTYWPKCDPSQSKHDNQINGYEHGYYCTQEWVDALNEMLSSPEIAQCNDVETLKEFLGQVCLVVISLRFTFYHQTYAGLFIRWVLKQLIFLQYIKF